MAKINATVKVVLDEADLDAVALHFQYNAFEDLNTSRGRALKLVEGAMELAGREFITRCQQFRDYHAGIKKQEKRNATRKKKDRAHAGDGTQRVEVDFAAHRDSGTRQD